MDKAIKGFTLIETMVVLMVMGIILGLGMPSFLNLMEKMGTESETKMLLEGLRTARLIAIEGKQNVVVCSSTDNENCGSAAADWDKGFLVYIDTDNNDELDSGEEILFTHQFKESLHITNKSEQNQPIYYNENGWAAGSADTIYICAKEGSDENAYSVIISRAGRPRVLDWRHSEWQSPPC